MNSNSVYRDAAKVCAIIFVLGIIEFIIFTICLSLRLDILIGILYGCTFTTISFLYLAHSVKKSIEKSDGKAKMSMAMSYNFRLFSTAVMIIVASKAEFIHLWAAIIPLFFQRIAVHIVDFLNSRRNKGSETF